MNDHEHYDGDDCLTKADVLDALMRVSAFMTFHFMNSEPRLREAALKDAQILMELHAMMSHCVIDNIQIVHPN